MELDPLNKFLLKISGTTGKAIKYAVLDRDNQAAGAAFFKPYKSLGNMVIKSQAILTAPLWLAIVSLETLIAGIGFALKSMVDFYEKGEQEATVSITMSGLFLLTALCTAFSALLSPLVNLIDCIGTLVTQDPVIATPAVI